MGAGEERDAASPAADSAVSAVAADYERAVAELRATAYRDGRLAEAADKLRAAVLLERRDPPRAAALADHGRRLLADRAAARQQPDIFADPPDAGGRESLSHAADAEARR